MRIKEKYKMFEVRYPSLMKKCRFMISGGTATLINILLVFVLTHYVRLWYLLSSILGFMGGFFISFFMQKFWTFQDASKDKMQRQAMLFLVAMGMGCGLNALLVYCFVEYLTLHYLTAQIISGIFIAVANYFAYKLFVFKNK